MPSKDRSSHTLEALRILLPLMNKQSLQPGNGLIPAPHRSPLLKKQVPQHTNGLILALHKSHVNKYFISRCRGCQMQAQVWKNSYVIQQIVQNLGRK